MAPLNANGAAAENSCLLAGRQVPSYCASNGNNYIFVQQSANQNQQQSEESNFQVASHQNLMAFDSHPSKLSESVKQAQIQMFKAYLSDYSDERIRQVLTEFNWDYMKALDAMMCENFRQADSYNQSRLSETHATYARQCHGNVA